MNNIHRAFQFSMSSLFLIQHGKYRTIMTRYNAQSTESSTYLS